MKVIRLKDDYLNFKESGGFEIDASMKRGAEGKEFERVPSSDVSIVFLKQHIGKAGESLVSEGDTVKKGEKIGDCNGLGTPVHSPVYGEVEKVEEVMHPGLGEECEAIFIRKKDGEKEVRMDSFEKDELDNLDAGELLEVVREAGIVGLGGACFPTDEKLASENISHLILNAKESDPNVACDTQLMREEPQKMVDGILAMAKILDVENVIFASRSPGERFPKLKKLLEENDIEMVKIKPSYSIGQEKLLIKEVLRKEVPSGGVPPDVNVIVHNVSTAYAVSEAVFEGKPLTSRGVTFISKNSEPVNLWVDIGAKIKDILNFAGLNPENFESVVMGSVFMGGTAHDLNTPMIKSVNGIFGIEKGSKDPFEDRRDCIRCGYCNEVCPVDIYPILIRNAEKKSQISRLDELNILDCIDCGLCSYVCPVKINFTQSLRRSKSKVLEKKKY